MKKIILAALLILVSVVGVLGLAYWNYNTIRRDLLGNHEQWAQRMSSMVAIKRAQLANWVDSFPANNINLQQLADIYPDVAALIYIDLKKHLTEQWVDASLHTSFTKLPPELGVLQIRAQESGKTQVGPLVFIKRTPFATVVRPVDASHVLIVYIRDSSYRYLIHNELTAWRYRGLVTDFDGQAIYASERLKGADERLSSIIERVHIQQSQGIISLPWRDQLATLATFHYDKANNWVYILVEEAPTKFLPLLFFFMSLAGLFIFVRILARASEKLRKEVWTYNLKQFSNQVDSYIRGFEANLPDPGPPIEPLTQVATVVRWMMPQWKKAEAFPRELVLEKRLLALLIESLPEGILFFNGQGNLQLANELGRVFLTLHQENPAEPRKINGVQVARGFLEPFLEPVFSGTQPNLGKEVEVSWADGKHLYRVWVERVDGEDNSILGFIAVVRDITFRKQWEYVQEQVLSGITHDLRGPLSALMGYMDLTRRQLGANAPGKVGEYLSLAREAGLRLSQMVSDILDVVRFEQGKIDLEIQDISVGEMFERLQHTFGVLAEQKKVRLLIEIKGDKQIRTAGDRKLLERVFDNLVGNAIKFTPSQGTITVTARRSVDRVIFDVTDTGRGIPREAQSRIFDKFQQVRPGDRSSGYGLGLAVAKFIVEAHRGEIRVESEVGSGSRFTFWIPDTTAAIRQ